jgi:hypothetical protein
VGRVANREYAGTGNEVFSGHCFSSYQDPHQIPPPPPHLQPEEQQQQVNFLEALFVLSILGDAIVDRVLAAFSSGVATHWLG